MFLSFAPNFYLTISKTAKTYYYQPIRLSTSTLGYQIFPYLLVIAALLISVFYIRYLNLIRKIETANSDIAKQISASETTSKVFCHFIKNELLGIQSEIATLPSTSENEEQIQLLLKHCQLLYNRIDSIHRSTKTSELHLKKTSLYEVLRSTLELLKSELKNIEVIEKFPKEEVFVLADSEYLGQALHNLIHNAITAMEDKAKAKDFSPKLIFEVYQTEKWLILTVEDNGTGISENNISQIFTPFFSSKPFSEHWGVGLSLTHKIIQAHDGHVQVESVYGKGTCFKILLPNFFNIYV
jgi:signal transduction histidine kinase